MKKGLLTIALLGAAVLGYFLWSAKQAKAALVASLCSQELDAELTEITGSTMDAMKLDAKLVGAANAFRMQQAYERSSLKPHLKALQRMGDPSLVEIKELAHVAASQCPDVFPEPVKAEKPMAIVWLFARQPD